MKLAPCLLVVLATACVVTCYRPPPPPPRYLPHPPKGGGHYRRPPHPSSHAHHYAPRYPQPRPPPFARPFAPPRFVNPSLPYRPLPRVVPHPYQLQVVDDDSGPIHTIPAPKLGPHDRPAHFDELEQHRIAPIEPPRPAFFGYQQEQHFLSHQQAYLDSNDVAGKTADGAHAYYAPDPDPSLPARRVPPTFDPHSSPSNGRPPPADLLPANNGVAPTVDSYGVPVVLHSFDYQEPYYRRSGNAGGDPAPVHEATYAQGDAPAGEVPFLRPTTQRQDQVQEMFERENHAQEEFHRANEERDKAQEASNEKAAFFEKVDGPAFSVLPNQEVAETLATLAAAGNINSNIINKAKDVQEAEDYVEEEIQKAGAVPKVDDDRDYVTDEDKEVQLVFGTRIKQL